MEGEGNSNFVLHTREVHHSESVSQWFLLEVEEPSNGNLLKGAFTKYFKEGFVVHGKKQVTAAQYKELCFVHRLGQITFILARQLWQPVSAIAESHRGFSYYVESAYHRALWSLGWTIAFVKGIGDSKGFSFH